MRNYSEVMNDGYILDLVSYTWKEVVFQNSPLEGKVWHSSISEGNYIYFFGGMLKDFTYTNEILRIDTTKFSWKKIN